MKTKKRRVYLDNAATTPVDSRVVAAMMPYFSKIYGNTMSVHSLGEKTAWAVEKARKTVARFIGAEAGEIVFTGSASESNNWVLRGLAEANPEKKTIIISAIEHDCIEETALWMESKGYVVRRVPVNDEGIVDINFLKNSIDENTLVVSVIHGNNEMGAIQDIGKIGEICRERRVPFHTDASQSLGKVKIDVKKQQIDLLTGSGHKIYGPKGVAFLYIKKGIRIEPFLRGGGHEEGRRSSTVNAAAIVGHEKAIDLLSTKENKRIGELRDKLIEGILKKISGSRLNGPKDERLNNNVNISFDKIEGEGLLMELDAEGISCSTGSACSSNSLEPSRVLTAMGLSAVRAHGSIRFSLGRWTTKEDINYVLKVLPKAVAKLRKISPFK